MEKTKLIIFSIATFCSLSVIAQKAELLSSSKFPAEPFGGSKGLTQLVKQNIIYPKEALLNDVDCEVFVLFKVNKLGKIIEAETKNCSDSSLNKEALRLLNLSLWEKDEIREMQRIGTERLKITFSPKKYKKIVKKRNPTTQQKLIEYKDATKFYYPTQLDSTPKPINYETVNAFVTENMKYPSLALERKISGKVILQFIIEPYGEVSNIRIVQAVAGGCNEETIRLMKSIEWKPGYLDGVPVRTLFEYSLSFNHPGSTFR